MRAVRLASVRTRFGDLYPAEGDDEAKRADAKRKAFVRALASAHRHDLIGSVELNGLDHIWLKPDVDRTIPPSKQIRTASSRLCPRRPPNLPYRHRAGFLVL